MRRATLVLLTWALGTAGSVGLGSLGVQLVTSTVTPPRTSPLTRPEVVAALSVHTAASSDIVSALPAVPTGARDPASPPAASPPATSKPAPRPSPVETAANAAASTVAGPSSARGPARSQDRSRSQKESSEQSSGEVTPKGEDDARSAASVRGGQATVRTIQSQGGAVAVRFEGSTTTLAWARPNGGFEVVVNSKGPGFVDVAFRNGRHVSRIAVWVGRDGNPAQRVRESRSRSGRGGGDGNSDD